MSNQPLLLSAQEVDLVIRLIVTLEDLARGLRGGLSPEIKVFLRRLKKHKEMK